MYAGLYSGGRFLIHTLPILYLLSAIYFKNKIISFNKNFMNILLPLSPALFLITISSLNNINSDAYAVSDYNYGNLSQLFPRINLWELIIVTVIYHLNTINYFSNIYFTLSFSTFLIKS